MRGALLTRPSFCSAAVSFLLQNLRLSSTAVSVAAAVGQQNPAPDSSSPSTSAQTPLPECTSYRSAADVFRRWGCSDADVSVIIQRYPSIARKKLPSLDAKLRLLHDLGFLGHDLVRLVTRRPAFLAHSKEKILGDLAPRLEFLGTLFTSDAGVRAAIIRNPSLLTCDIGTMRRCIDLYESVGVTRAQLGVVLRGRPTTMNRSKLDAQKLEIIHGTEVTRDSALYKYVVSIVAVSKLETLQEKIANIQKFGFSADEVLKLFGRSPYAMTLSVEKVQRNMTYVVGTLKLQPQFVLSHPELLFINLDKVLRPRFLLICKLQEMGLQPRKNAALYTAMRMTEEMFLKRFVICHEKQHVMVLTDFYNEVRGVRRLAEKSRKIHSRGFPY